MVFAEAFDVEPDFIEWVLFGEDPVSPGESFEELGIEEGARLSLRVRDEVY